SSRWMVCGSHSQTIRPPFGAQLLKTVTAFGAGLFFAAQPTRQPRSRTRTRPLFATSIPVLRDRRTELYRVAFDRLHHRIRPETLPAVLLGVAPEVGLIARLAALRGHVEVLEFRDPQRDRFRGRENDVRRSHRVSRGIAESHILKPAAKTQSPGEIDRLIVERVPAGGVVRKLRRIAGELVPKLNDDGLDLHERYGGDRVML